LEDIVQEVGPSVAGRVRQMVEQALREHYVVSKDEPLTLTYQGRAGGYLLFARSSIGLIDCYDFEIEILPKLPDLSIGKCLQMAHKIEHLSLVRHANRVVEETLSDAVQLHGVEYFA